MNDADDFLDKKPETLHQALKRCREIIANPQHKRWRRKAFWAEKSLGRFETDLSEKLEKEDWYLPRETYWRVTEGMPASEFPAGNQRKFASVIEMQTALISFAIDDDDPYGFKDRDVDSKKRRPKTAPYTPTFLRAAACLIKAELVQARSFSKCWNDHMSHRGRAPDPPRKPKLGNQRITPQRAAKMILNILSAEQPPVEWDESQLIAVKKYAKAAITTFKTTPTDLQGIAEN